MRHPIPAIGDNIHFLEQGIELLQSIDGATYTRKDESFGSGIGAHLRHCIDHYESFLGDYRSDCIDYDHRKRDPRIEEDITFASAQLSSIIDRLGQIGAQDVARTIDTKMDCGTPDPEPVAPSSVKRELQFLVSHTLHHYALIALQLKQQNQQVLPGFGMAPSTVRFQAENSARKATRATIQDAPASCAQ